MFDIGWSEMAVIALIALLVIGPKDLPKVMRSAAHWARKARGLAREFQSGVDDMIREADLDDARKMVESAKSLDVSKVLGETVDPTGDLRDEVADIEKSARDAVEASEGDGDDGGDSDGKDEKVAADAANAGAEPNIAPPHSLTPPQDSPVTPPSPEPANQPANQPAADDSAGKRAS